MTTRILSYILVFSWLQYATTTHAEDSYFDSKEVKIHYIDEGEGIPVLLIHGFTGDIERAWRQRGTIESLIAAQFRVVAFDNRGHGKSDKPRDPEKYGLEMVSDAERLLDHLEISRAHVIGYSMGSRMKIPFIAIVIAWFSLVSLVHAQDQRKPSDLPSSEYRRHFAEDGGIGATSGLINPQAWHHDGKTFVVYQGEMNAPTITFYDHRKQPAMKGGRWAPNVKVGVNPLGNKDTHGTPSLLIDKQGYIHVFYGSHGGLQKYSRSKSPYDITEWVEMPPVSPQMTYPCGAMLDNGTMVLIGRAGGHVSPWVELTSSDSGKTWSKAKPIVDFRPHALYGTVKPGAEGKTVHFTWSLQAKGDLIKGTSVERFSTGRGKYGYGNTVVDNRHNCFYMRRDQNGRWYNIQGEPLQTPIDMKTAYQKCLVYRGDWPLHGQHGTMGIDKHDKPHIVFLVGKMPADKAKWHTNNVDYTYKYARWDGDHWVLSDITTTDSIWDMGQAIFPEPDGSVDVYLVARGSVTDDGRRTTKGRIGGNIEQWRSEDHGKTWKKIKDVITYNKTGRLFNCPHAVVNAHPDSKVMFSTWSTDEYFQQGDFTQFVYLYGDSGFCSRRYKHSPKR